MASKVFSLDGPLMEALGKVADIAVINLLWLITSLPIFTIGASTESMYYMLRKIKKGEDTHLIKDYFKEFKTDFLKKMLVGFILIGFLLLLLVNLTMLITTFLECSLSYCSSYQLLW